MQCHLVCSQCLGSCLEAKLGVSVRTLRERSAPVHPDSMSTRMTFSQVGSLHTSIYTCKPHCVSLLQVPTFLISGPTSMTGMGHQQMGSAMKDNSMDSFLGKDSSVWSCCLKIICTSPKAVKFYCSTSLLLCSLGFSQPVMSMGMKMNVGMAPFQSSKSPSMCDPQKTSPLFTNEPPKPSQITSNPRDTNPRNSQENSAGKVYHHLRHLTSG